MTLPDPAHAVYTLLEEITLRPRSDFRDTVRLGRDLQLGSESYTLRLIPELQARLSIQPSQLEWDSVATVQDLLQLTEAHVRRQRLGVSSSPVV